MFFRHKSRDTASIQLEAQIQALADAVAAQSSRLESLQLAVEQQIHERNQSMHQNLAEPDIHTAPVPAKPDNSMQKPDEPDSSAKQKPGRPDSSIMMMYGSDDLIEYEITSKSGNSFKRTEYIEGVCSLIERRYMETTSQMSREWYATFLAEAPCLTCGGKRLNEHIQNIQVSRKSRKRGTAI